MHLNLPKPLKLLLSAWGGLWLGLATLIFGTASVIGGLLGIRDDRLAKLGRGWGRMVCAGVGIKIKAEGMENLAPGGNYVFASNHTSALDIPVLFTLLPSNFRWIAKNELFKIPLFGNAMTSLGYIPIDRSDNRAAMRSISRAAERIAAGASVLIFPEGTRSDSRKLLPFKSGGMALPIRARAQVAPMAILGAAAALPPRTLQLSPGTVRVIFGKPLPIEGYTMKQRDELAAKVQEAVQELLDQAGGA